MTNRLYVADRREQLVFWALSGHTLIQIVEDLLSPGGT